MSAAALEETVRLLWPGDGGPAGRELIFVPNASAPRLMVPAGRPAAAARAVRRFSTALSGRERAQRVVTAAVLRCGGERLLRDRLPVPSGTDSVEAHLSALLDREVVVSLGVGSLRANRKPVLQVFDRAGRSVAFVKVGDSAPARDLVRGEAAALREVGGRDWTLLEVPRLIRLDTWRGLDLLVMTALDTPALESRRPAGGGTAPPGPPLEAMAELAAAFDGGVRPLAGSPFWAQLEERAGALGDADGDRFRALLDTAADRYGDRPVRWGAWHGDWAPWNMARRRGRVQLWDWEQFRTGVPAGLDRVHYVVNTMTRQEGFTPAVLDRALARSAAGPRTGEVAGTPPLPLLYLAAITERYLTGSRRPGGDPLRPQAGVVLDAFDRLATGDLT